MKGDISRNTFNPREHFSIVEIQQGRVQLDDDWNEQSSFIDIQKCFDTILRSLKNEDKWLLNNNSIFQEIKKILPLDEVGGLFNVDERHIQYILYKTLLGMGNYRVYIEDPYGRKGKKSCDITLYTPDWKKSVWIEIKATGWCWEEAYKKWIKADAKKLKELTKKRSGRYLLVTSIEDGKQDKIEWKRWFIENFAEISFTPNLFGSFLSSKFRDGKKTIEGYYTVCLLKVI